MENNVICKHYIVVEDWMIEKLHLFPKEVFVFATLYAFTKSDCGMFTGSVSQLASLSFSSKAQVSTTVNKLIGEGVIVRGECIIKGKKTLYYKVNTEKINPLFFASDCSASERSASERSATEQNRSASEQNVQPLNAYNKYNKYNKEEKIKKLFFNAHAREFSSEYKPFLDFVEYVVKQIGNIDDYFPNHFITEKEYKYLESKYKPDHIASKVLAYANKKEQYKGKVGNNFFVTIKQWLERDSMNGKISSKS